MKEVVVVTGSMIRGGAEGVIASVANGLAQRGWRIHIISILFDKCDYSLDSSIKCVNVSKTKNNQILDTPRMVVALRRKIKAIKPDAVISFMVTVNIVTWLATRGLNVRFIPSERSDPDKGANTVIKILQQKAYGAADCTVFQTTKARDFFPQRTREKSIIIPNPVLKMPEATSIKSKRIVTAGRLEEEKNHKLLIDAFANVYKRHKDFSVDIYGDGTLRGELLDYIEKKGLSGVVHLCGKVENVPERIRDAYMFVLPSNYEGLSNALLESMAVGLPCITTNCAGSDDAIMNGVNGLIVPVKEEKDMEEAMCWLIDNPMEAAEMGKKARESMDRYEFDAVIDKWESILSK
jgi:glycosyltransferase involved in cell wall biosynthesis